MFIDKFIKCLLLLLATFLLGTEGFPQADIKRKVARELEEVSRHYRFANCLQFFITYKYSEEQRPKAILDSLKGVFRLNGDQYWYSLDQTESIGNKDTVLMFFKEDSIIYISKPPRSIMAVSPVSLVDSFLVNNAMLRCDYLQGGSENKITLDFGDSSTYRRVEYIISVKTHFISKIRCIVKSSELYDQMVKPIVEGGAAYAVIDIEFSDYREKAFDAGLFNLSRYFKKDGDDYVALPPYNSYKIFLGTPNL